MGRCLGCKEMFNEEKMVNTIGYLLEGINWNDDMAGYYCKDCVGAKEICNYCGVPVKEITYRDNRGLDNIGFCKDCYEEVKGYL